MLLKIFFQLYKRLQFEVKRSCIFYLFLSKNIDIDSYVDALSQGEASQSYIWFVHV